MSTGTVRLLRLEHSILFQKTRELFQMMYEGLLCLISPFQNIWSIMFIHCGKIR